jgi:hypothetical protein
LTLSLAAVRGNARGWLTTFKEGAPHLRANPLYSGLFTGAAICNELTRPKADTKYRRSAGLIERLNDESD